VISVKRVDIEVSLTSNDLDVYKGCFHAFNPYSDYHLELRCSLPNIKKAVGFMPIAFFNFKIHCLHLGLSKTKLFASCNNMKIKADSGGSMSLYRDEIYNHAALAALPDFTSTVFA
jgi:hypothetical protein